MNLTPVYLNPHRHSLSNSTHNFSFLFSSSSYENHFAFFSLFRNFFFSSRPVTINTASTPLHHTKWSPFFSLLNLSERRRSITHKNVENIVLPLRTVKSPPTKDKPIDMFQGHFWMLLCESMSPWNFRLVRIKTKKKRNSLEMEGSNQMWKLEAPTLLHFHFFPQGCHRMLQS